MSNESATGTVIAEYNPVAAALATLRERHAGQVYEVTTAAGMKLAREARAEVKGYRVSLEKVRKEIKAPALQRCADIDAEAKRITAELLKLEEPIDQQIKSEESRKAAEKAAAEEAERQRIADIQQRIDSIRRIAVDLAGAPAATVTDAIDRLAANEVTLELYAELAGEALQAKARTIAQLEDLHQAAVGREAEQARIIAERAELERLRAAQAERDRIAAEERAQADAKAKAGREAAEAEIRAQRAAQEAEQRRVAAEQAAAQAEIDRQRREFAEQQAAAAKAEVDRTAAAERAKREKAEAKERAEREMAERKARDEFIKNGPGADEITNLIAAHYGVDAETAISWLGQYQFAIAA